MGFLFEVINLNKSYFSTSGKAIPIIRDLNFKLPTKGMFFIYGKSGCGKTTLLNIMEGLSKPTSGELLYKGKSLLTKDSKKLNLYLKKEIGIVFQSINLFDDLSVEDNILISLEAKGLEKNDYIKILKRLRIDNYLNQKVSKLSGGEKQRVAIARALLNNPSCIFADEPTGNLDKENSINIMEIFKELSKERLIIVVTHNMELVERYSDGYLDLSSGKQKEIDKCNKKEENINEAFKSKTKIKTYLKHNLKKDKIINILTMISVSFSLFCSLLVSSIYFGSKNCDSLAINYQDYNTYKISKIVENKILDSKLNIQKIETPNLQELNDDFKKYNIEIHNDFSFFLNNSTIKLRNINLNEVEFIPTNSILDNSVYINNSFYSKYKDIDDYMLDSNLYVYFRDTYQFKKDDSIIKERLSLDFNFKIKKIVKEFPLLETPKIYYSIYYVENMLKEKFISNNKSSYFDLIEQAESNNIITNYSKIFFINNFELVNRFNREIEYYSNYSIKNNPKIIVDSFKELNESLEFGLLIFVIILISLSIILISFMSYTSFVVNRKESAILSILGLEENRLIDVYVINKIIIGFVGIIFGFALFKITSVIINRIVFNYFLFKNLFYDFLDLKTILLIIFIIIFGIVISVYIPLKFTKNNELYKELKEE